MSETTISDDLVFHVHLIWMSGPQQDPTVRMLLVASAGARAVYEGLGSWLTFSQWISKFLWKDIQDKRLNIASKILIREKYAAFTELRVPFCELESFGLHRVDR
jgi:hypothetical protein